MARLVTFAKTMSGRVIEHDAKIPDEYLVGSPTWVYSA